jgi:hypothetical protein
MRWRYILGALLGAFVGFVGQIAADFFLLENFGDSSHMGKPCSAYTAIFGSGTEAAVAKYYPHSSLGQARLLFCQGILLMWLTTSADRYYRTAAVVCVVTVPAMLVCDRLTHRQAK